GLVRGREQELVADREAARGDPADQDATLVELVDVLNRQAQRQIDRRRAGHELIERLEHGRALVPAHVPAAGRDAVALARRDRDEAGRTHAEAGQVLAVLLGDVAEALG